MLAKLKRLLYPLYHRPPRPHTDEEASTQTHLEQVRRFKLKPFRSNRRKKSYMWHTVTTNQPILYTTLSTCVFVILFVGSRRADSRNEQADECRDTKGVNHTMKMWHKSAHQLWVPLISMINSQQYVVTERGVIQILRREVNYWQTSWAWSSLHTEAKEPRSNRWCCSILELQSINQHGETFRDGPREAHRYMKQLLNVCQSALQQRWLRSPKLETNWYITSSLFCEEACDTMLTV